MRRYILILLINLITINSFSNGLIELSGYIIFNETNAKVANIGVNFLSLDLFHDTTIYTDNKGFYKVTLPNNQYRIMITNDSLIGVSTINLLETKSNDFIVYYNFMHDYKIFKTGFQQIFIGNNSVTLGLKNNGEFRRMTFVGIYAAYSFIENGLINQNGDTVITQTKSVDCYNNMNMDRIGHIENYIKKHDSIDYLIDKNNIRFNLIKFKDLEKEYNKK